MAAHVTGHPIPLGIYLGGAGSMTSNTHIRDMLREKVGAITDDEYNNLKATITASTKLQRASDRNAYKSSSYRPGLVQLSWNVAVEVAQSNKYPVFSRADDQLKLDIVRFLDKLTFADSNWRDGSTPNQKSATQRQTATQKQNARRRSQAPPRVRPAADPAVLIPPLPSYGTP
jgi:hypothetical protein